MEHRIQGSELNALEYIDLLHSRNENLQTETLFRRSILRGKIPVPDEGHAVSHSLLCHKNSHDNQPMKSILQRVSSASVVVDGITVGSISTGIMALVGFGKDDSESKLRPMLEKILTLRIFANDLGRFDRSLIDIKGELLLVPQFTLFADTSKGRRPEFFNALAPAEASRLFEKLVTLARETPDLTVASGSFGADMKVSLTNDGPVTISLEN